MPEFIIASNHSKEVVQTIKYRGHKIPSMPPVVLYPDNALQRHSAFTFYTLQNTYSGILMEMACALTTAYETAI